MRKVYAANIEVQLNIFYEILKHVQKRNNMMPSWKVSEKEHKI